MKDEKKVTKAEEVKEEVQTEEKGTPLTDEEMAQVTAGFLQWTDPEINNQPTSPPSIPILPTS